ncbi:MAG: hypothetical protein M1834_007928 [Cirrosporium novae-zelandiae]|nr:MAG: hypothetical protein M1834_007928 [Cirrosporium novae-zelandiae]
MNAAKVLADLHTKKKKWRVPAKYAPRKSHIEPGDCGIFVTCDKGKEGQCMRESKDIFTEYIQKLYPPGPEQEDKQETEDLDIEAELQKELDALKKPAAKNSSAVEAISLDIPCVVFLRLPTTVDPVLLVHTICVDAARNKDQKNSRWIRRMTPVTSTRKVLGSGIEELAALVLPPHFGHGGDEKEDVEKKEASKKYAIRPTMRSHNSVSRGDLIKRVADKVDAVSLGHTVDLQHYDLLILVDVYKNICGMSVVGNDFEQLKRFNLAEIYNPTPPPQPKSSTREPSPDMPAIKNLVRQVLHADDAIDRVDRLDASLYPMYLLHFVDIPPLVLKMSPEPLTRTLRLESQSLNSEAEILYMLRSQPKLPIPELVQYIDHSHSTGKSILLRKSISGTSYSNLAPYMNRSQKEEIERQLGTFMAAICGYVSSMFGPVSNVSSNSGSKSWREAFTAMFESLLRDAEDMLVSVDYEELRYQLERFEPFLDEVTEAHLVFPEIGNAHDIIIDPHTNQVVGLVNFENAMWGDPLLMDVVRNASPSFLVGLGCCSVKPGSCKVRRSIYQCFRAVQQVVVYYYRPSGEDEELRARKALSNAIAELASLDL